tara:strand:- start:7522 stop:8721 length:1200 start_codon:yes stop_codon:yes gene_type:complete
MSKELSVDHAKQEVSSGFVEFYELQIGTGSNNTLYFHPGKNENIQDITYDGNTYISMPIFLSGVELTSSGALSRPTLTIANVESIIKSQSKFKTQMEDGTWGAVVDSNPITATEFKLDHLIGSRLTRRRTLEKYLSSDPTVEFPIETYIIDRIENRDSLLVTLELVSPYDVSGIRIPTRVVIGKYCPWLYQGASTENTTRKGACYWKMHSQYVNTDGTSSIYVTVDDEPLFKKSAVEGLGTGVYFGSGIDTSNGHDLNDFVKVGGQYYRSRTASNSNQDVTNTVYWTLCRVYTVWSNDSGSTNYTVDANDTRKNSYVWHGNTVWRAVKAHTKTATYTPELGSSHWVRADICGKLLKSCKMRYQAEKANTNTGTDFITSDELNTDASLPFGGFPGSRKFR